MPKILKSSRFNQSRKLALTIGIFGILLVWFVSAWLMLALVTYSPSDPGMSWSSTSTEIVISNSGGRIGALAADVGRTVFGFTIFFVACRDSYRWLALVKKATEERINSKLCNCCFCTRNRFYLTQWKWTGESARYVPISKSHWRHRWV